MVAMTLFFRRRFGEDINDFNFIQDIDPIGIGENGFPLFRDILHPDFAPNAYTFLQTDVNDIYGMFTTFYIKSPRKMRQNKIQVTIKQKSNLFQVPIYFIALFGFRPCAYDPETQNVTALSNSYTLDRSVNMMCTNTSLDLKSEDTASVGGLLSGIGTVPSPILLSGGGIYRDHPLHDACMVTVFQTTNTVVANNNVYTTHDLVTPLFNHVPDVASFGKNIIFQGKIQVYLATPDYALTTESKLRLMTSDQIVSLGGDFDVI